MSTTEKISIEIHIRTGIGGHSPQKDVAKEVKRNLEKADHEVDIYFEPIAAKAILPSEIKLTATLAALLKLDPVDFCLAIAPGLMPIYLNYWVGTTEIVIENKITTTEELMTAQLHLADTISILREVGLLDKTDKINIVMGEDAPQIKALVSKKPHYVNTTNLSVVDQETNLEIARAKSIGGYFEHYAKLVEVSRKNNHS